MAQEATYKWVQDRLRELHAGNISVDDRQQLQQLAQDDPFIADALEGFESHPHYPHLRTLNDLTSRIRPVKRVRRRWLIPNLTVTAVAASMILIVGFWAVMSRINKDDEFATAETSHEVIIDDSAALAESGGRDQDQLVATEELSEPESSTTADAVEKQSSRTAAPGSITKPGSSAVAKQAEKSPTDIAVTRDEIAVSPSSATTVLSESATPAEATIVQDDVKEEAHDPMYFANQMDPGIMARRAAGRVISESGTPLIGANLSIRNTNLGTASDLDGKFELFLPTPESTVDISFSGYEGASVKLKQGEEDVAILLPEVKIDRAYTKTQQAETAGRKTPTGAAVMNASTANQQIAYTDYLRNNSRYPLKDNLYTPGRDVTVKFDVTANGEPTRVRIATSSNDRQLDEEAMRLIRKGPLWVCDGEQYPCEITYTIYFR